MPASLRRRLQPALQPMCKTNPNDGRVQDWKTSFFRGNTNISIRRGGWCENRFLRNEPKCRARPVTAGLCVKTFFYETNPNREERGSGATDCKPAGYLKTTWRELTVPKAKRSQTRRFNLKAEVGRDGALSRTDSVAAAPHPGPLPADAGRGRDSPPLARFVHRLDPARPRPSLSTKPRQPQKASAVDFPLPSLARGEGQGEGCRPRMVTASFRLRLSHNALCHNVEESSQAAKIHDRWGETPSSLRILKARHAQEGGSTESRPTVFGCGFAALRMNDFFRPGRGLLSASPAPRFAPRAAVWRRFAAKTIWAPTSRPLTEGFDPTTMRHGRDRR